MRKYWILLALSALPLYVAIGEGRRILVRAQSKPPVVEKSKVLSPEFQKTLKSETSPITTEVRGLREEVVGSLLRVERKPFPFPATGRSQPMVEAISARAESLARAREFVTRYQQGKDAPSWISEQGNYVVYEKALQHRRSEVALAKKFPRHVLADDWTQSDTALLEEYGRDKSYPGYQGELYWGLKAAVSWKDLRAENRLDEQITKVLETIALKPTAPDFVNVTGLKDIQAACRTFIQKYTQPDETRTRPDTFVAVKKYLALARGWIELETDWTSVPQFTQSQALARLEHLADLVELLSPDVREEARKSIHQIMTTLWLSYFPNEKPPLSNQVVLIKPNGEKKEVPRGEVKIRLSNLTFLTLSQFEQMVPDAKTAGGAEHVVKKGTEVGGKVVVHFMHNGTIFDTLQATPQNQAAKVYNAGRSALLQQIATSGENPDLVQFRKLSDQWEAQCKDPDLRGNLERELRKIEAFQKQLHRLVPDRS